jgi:SAM-dependent methyltransferase
MPDQFPIDVHESAEDEYDGYHEIEEAFKEALDESLAPRGPEMLYDLVADFALAAGARAADIGCGEGRHTLQLAKRFGFSVVGIDPVRHNIEAGRVALAEASAEQPELADLVTFEVGRAQHIPLEDESVDLVWCRDVLVLLDPDDLGSAYAEFARVLRPGGRVLVYQMFGTDRLEPREAALLFENPERARPARSDAAIAASGLRLEACIDLGTEWGEYLFETSGKPSRSLVHASRLLRQPDRYMARFGKAAYDTMFADCLWHVYGMIGKFNRRVYLLTRV